MGEDQQQPSGHRLFSPYNGGASASGR
jgi:hypothetical protein